MKDTIEVIELNDGSIIVQDTDLKQAIYLGHKTNQSCKDSLPCLLKGEGIDGWDSGDHEQEFITDEVYAEQSQNGEDRARHDAAGREPGHRGLEQRYYFVSGEGGT